MHPYFLTNYRVLQHRKSSTYEIFQSKCTDDFTQSCDFESFINFEFILNFQTVRYVFQLFLVSFSKLVWKFSVFIIGKIIGCLDYWRRFLDWDVNVEYFGWFMSEKAWYYFEFESAFQSCKLVCWTVKKLFCCLYRL